MFKNILIPTDGSEQSQRAVRTGVDLAKLHGARVTGVHVIPDYHLLIAYEGAFDPVGLELGQIAADGDRAALVFRPSRGEKNLSKGVSHPVAEVAFDLSATARRLLWKGFARRERPDRNDLERSAGQSFDQVAEESRVQVGRLFGGQGTDQASLDAAGDRRFGQQKDGSAADLCFRGRVRLHARILPPAGRRFPHREL